MLDWGQQEQNVFESLTVLNLEIIEIWHEI